MGTAQPASDDPNGFRALAVVDQPGEGGNGDGWITPEDAVYARLGAWIDLDHDGQSDPGEMSTLPEAGIAGLSLEYRLSNRRDRFDNFFRYRAKVLFVSGEQRYAYDVRFR